MQKTTHSVFVLDPGRQVSWRSGCQLSKLPSLMRSTLAVTLLSAFGAQAHAAKGHAAQAVLSSCSTDPQAKETQNAKGSLAFLTSSQAAPRQPASWDGGT